ncbi:MAG: hypothetical protein QXF09_00950 [Nitrososphaerota archaeon]
MIKQYNAISRITSTLIIVSLLVTILLITQIYLSKGATIIFAGINEIELKNTWMNKTASGDFYFNLKVSNIGSVNIYIKDIKINDKSYKDFHSNVTVYIFYSNRKMEIFNKENQILPLITPGDYIIVGVKIPYNPKLEGEKISVGVLTSRGQYDITLTLTFKEYT